MIEWFHIKMSLIHHQLRTQALKNIHQKNGNSNFLKRRRDDFHKATKNIEPIIDMSSQMNEVRKSKITLNQDLVNATSSRRV